MYISTVSHCHYPILMIASSAAYLASFDHQQALEHFGEVMQVEGVVSLGRSGQQLLADTQVHLDAALHHGPQQSALHI